MGGVVAGANGGKYAYPSAAGSGECRSVSTGKRTAPGHSASTSSRARSPLLEAHRFLRRGPVSEEGWSQLVAKDREWERSYRGRWAHDKVVRSTHGVNCTGSCSWNVYVKDGLITWESQAVDYPSTGAEMPEYEPRGCPRGASFSWYQYSPLRLKYPYVRGSLLAMFREARTRLGDPVDAWAEIVEDPEKVRLYPPAGKGGFVRASSGRGRGADRRRARRTRSSAMGRIGASASRRSRRSRWPPTPPARVPVADRRGDPVVLRLVCRPAAASPQRRSPISRSSSRCPERSGSCSPSRQR